MTLQSYYGWLMAKGMPNNQNSDIVPYLRDDYIRLQARKFLDRHNANGILPLDFEEIIEFHLKIRIIPVPSLKRVYRIDAYMNHDFTVLTVDNQVYESNSGRLTFTYAHELGHMFLHNQVHQQADQIQSTSDYLSFHNSISEDDWRNMEIQANKFAAEVVFPHDVYMKFVDQLIADAGGERFIGMTDLRDILLEITQKFNVTETCALVQFQKTHRRIYNITTQNG